MKIYRVILLLAALGLTAFGQQVNVTANKLKGGAASPASSCSAQTIYLKTDGTLYTCTSGTMTMAGGGGSGASQLFSATKVAHGFAVLDPIYSDASGVWQKALATGASTLPTALVVAVTDANNFTYAGAEGVYTITGHGLNTANVYYLQNAGGLGTSAGTVSYVVGAPISANLFQYYGIRATGVPSADYGDITVSGSTWTIDSATVTVAKISATGTPSSSTFLRGDGAWASAAGLNATTGTLPYNNGTAFADSPATRVDATTIGVGSLLRLNGAGSGAAALTFNSVTLLRATDSNYRSYFVGQGGNTGMTGAENAGMGYLVLRALTTGSYNVALGTSAGDALTIGGENTFLGRAAGSGVVSGDRNTFIGALAGNTQAVTGSQNLLFGFNTRLPSTSANGQIVFNNFIVATGATDTGTTYGAGLLGIGTSAPATKLHILLDDATTNAVGVVSTVGHDSTGTAANGFGGATKYTLESSTTAAQDAAQIAVAWKDATHASRTSLIDLYDVYNAGSLGRIARFTEGRFSLMRAADANPGTSELTALGSSGGASIYVKGSKLVIAYNLAGVVNYLTIPLDGSTTTFTATTSAP